MAYKVKLLPYGKYSSKSDMNAAATAFGFPTSFVTSINFNTGYGYLLFEGDTEVDGMKFRSATRLDSVNYPTGGSWAEITDSDGNYVMNANNTEYATPAMTANLPDMAADSTYYICPAVSPACGKIDGVYYLPFNAEKGRYLEFNGKKYVTSGVSWTTSIYWLIAADPTE